MQHGEQARGGGRGPRVEAARGLAPQAPCRRAPTPPSATRQLGQLGGHGHPRTTHRQLGRRAGRAAAADSATPGVPRLSKRLSSFHPKAGRGLSRGQPRSPPPHKHGPLPSCLLLQPEGEEEAFCIPAFKTRIRDLKERHSRCF